MKPTDDELKALVILFQLKTGYGLAVDGIYGPKTRAAVRDYGGLDRGSLQGAWDYALFSVGKGGDPGKNNDSDFIRKLRQYCGFPVDVTGAWCAVFASYVLLCVGIDVKSRGAYRLCELLANTEGFKEISGYNAMVVGKVYLACWRRSRWNTHREAHVRFVRKTRAGTVKYIAGNERPDHVVRGDLLPGQFSQKLIMIVGEI